MNILEVLKICAAILPALAVIFLPPVVWRATAAEITADRVENISAENKYIATGNVIIKRGEATYKADRAVYDEKTQDMRLYGNVVLEDNDFLINTEQADFNAATKKGVLNNAIIYLKQGKNWIFGKDLQKLGDTHYYGKTVYFTACDSEEYRAGKALKPGHRPVSERPDWCLKGHDANIYVGDKVTAYDATFRIKDMPALYTPYFQGPAEKERKTGFLMPQFGNSSKKGLLFRPSFFWAIDDNRDATLTAEYYSKRGIGTGLEYRFVEPNHSGQWYGYYLRDRKLDETFVVARAHDRFTTQAFQAFIDVNYTNRWNYFNEYGDTFQASISRFLQSSAEVSAPLSFGGSSRAYLLGQYWVNLRGDISENIPQKLPEVGYVLNPTAVGPFVFSLAASAANFVRKSDPHGQRFDIMPTISHSVGDTVRLTQSVSFRETFYNLNEGGSFGSSPHREMFRYRAEAQTRFLKNYGSFLHIVEPSVEYNYIPNAAALPLFDATELPTKESVVSVGVLNRFVFQDITASLRVTQPFDTFASSQGSVMPTIFKGNAHGSGLPISFNFIAEYNSRQRRLDTLNSHITFRPFRDVTLGLGELYSSVDHMTLMTYSLTAKLSKRWLATIAGSYDFRADRKFRDVTATLTYREQCWSLKAHLYRKPSDGVNSAEYAFLVFIELRGFGSFKI